MYCDIKGNALFFIRSLSDTVKSVRSVHSPHAVYADQQRLFCVSNLILSRSLMSLHTGLDALGGIRAPP